MHILLFTSYDSFAQLANINVMVEYSLDFMEPCNPLRYLVRVSTTELCSVDKIKVVSSTMQTEKSWISLFEQCFNILNVYIHIVYTGICGTTQRFLGFFYTGCV